MQERRNGNEGIRSRGARTPVPIDLADVSVRIDAETAQWAVEEARATGKPHNDARAVFVDVVTWVGVSRRVVTARRTASSFGQRYTPADTSGNATVLAPISSATRKLVR